MSNENVSEAKMNGNNDENTPNNDGNDASNKGTNVDDVKSDGNASKFIVISGITSGIGLV